MYKWIVSWAYSLAAIGVAAFVAAPAGAQQSVGLTGTDNVYGIARPGAAITGGGIDSSGDAYSADELGPSVTWSGQTFQFAPPGPGSAAAAKVLALPAGQDVSLSILATAVEGNHPTQTFVVTYTDGSKTTFTQSLSDWHTPQNYAGESPVITTNYKLLSNGTKHLGAYSLYGYTFLLNSAKTVQSLTLPNTKDVVVLALNVTPAGGSSPGSGVGLGGADNLYGIANPGSLVTGGGIDGSGDAYPADQLGSSVTWSGQTFQLAAPGPNSAVTSRVINLTAAKAGSLSFLGTGVVGNQPGQTFVVTYTDGTKTSFIRSLSDWHTSQGYAGESIAATVPYKILSNGTKHLGSYSLYGYTLALDSTKTVQSLTLPNNPSVVLLALNVGGSSSSGGGGGGTTSPVGLNTLDNVYGIGTLGAAVTGGGIDGSGDAYPGDQLGSSVTWSGKTFALAPPGPQSAVSNKVIPLTAGKYASLSMLATGVAGNQPGQTFVVTYTDGSRTTFTQGLSDWHTPQHYAGESVAATTTYKLTSAGGHNTTAVPYSLYGYTFTLDGTKTAQSLTLPANSHVVVLAIDLTAARIIIPPPHFTAAPSLSPTPGTYLTSQLTITLQDATANATIYVTTDGSTPSPGSGTTFVYPGPFAVFSLGSTVTTVVKAMATSPGAINSLVTSGTYVVTTPVAATPVISPPAGIYGPQQLITLTDSTPAAQILYGVDEPILTPLPLTSLYTQPFALTAGSENRVTAQAGASGFNNSPQVSVTYQMPIFPSDVAALQGPGNFLYNNYAQATQNDGCHYYQAAGLSSDCVNNSPSGAITMQQWLDNVYGRIAQVNSLVANATFVNAMDLNFVREHHAVWNQQMGSNAKSAAYVCNFKGPDFYHDAPQHIRATIPEVDAAVSDAAHGLNPLPCVAFDYGIKPGVMRFLVFDQNGNLKPTVDLDGRGEKAVPNACSACHGVPVDAALPAAGSYQKTKTPQYIPFDEANLLFSSVPGYRLSDEEDDIRVFNLIALYGTGTPEPADPAQRSELSQLIHGWYDDANGSLRHTTQQFYVPAAFTPDANDPNNPATIDDLSAYAAIYAPMCRSCHIANSVQYPGFPLTTPQALKSLLSTACHPAPTQITNPAVMPNARVTFDRLWTTHVSPGRSTTSSDLVEFMRSYVGATSCDLPSSYNPYPNQIP